MVDVEGGEAVDPEAGGWAMMDGLDIVNSVGEIGGVWTWSRARDLVLLLLLVLLYVLVT